jgi:hypothetical protein
LRYKGGRFVRVFYFNFIVDYFFLEPLELSEFREFLDPEELAEFSRLLNES